MSKSVDVATLQQWLSEGRPVTVLDIRPREQNEEWRIPGSRHVDAYHALRAGDEEILGTLELPRDQPVVTVCVSGNTSQIAASQLESHGYDVFSLSGGMKAWSLAWNTAELQLRNGVEAVQVRRTGKGCLSYLVHSAGEGLVIDPSVEEQVYRDIAEEHHVRIVGVLDTHVHADHLSRARSLAEALAIPRYLPAQERVDCPFTPVAHGDRISFGNSSVEIIRTPGHTWESSIFAVDGALFTGDTLFTDSVGRPDLEVDSAEARERALALHDSLSSLGSYPGDTLVLPGHTDEPPGFDGVPTCARMTEVREGVALLSLGRDEFADYLTSHAPTSPPNHSLIVKFNEECELPGTVIDLEAGANRCAVH